jgi:hypothetical protein
LRDELYYIICGDRLTRPGRWNIIQT